MAATSSSTLGIHKLEDQITCPVCLEHYTNPKHLPCSHSLCLHCLQRLPIVLVEGNHSIDCPICRSPCPVPDNGLASLPQSFIINNLMEVYNLMKHERVSDHQNVSCGNCDHIMSCTDHNKPLDIFCETCQQLICHDCIRKNSKHRDHDYYIIKDSIIESGLQPLNQQHDRLEEAKEILINRRNEISQQTEGTKEEIHHTIAEIKNRLDETERKLKEEVELASSIKLRVLDHQVKEIDSVIGQVTECMDYVYQCIKVGSPQQLLLTKPQMMSRTQSVITSVKEKIFEPLEQPDIQLVKNDSIHQIHDSIGKVEYTLLPSLIKISGLSYRHIPLINQPSTVTISLNTVDSFKDDSLVPFISSLIKCHLTPPNNTPPIQCSVKESSQSGRYNVFLTPHTRGLHQLYITIGDSTRSSSIPVSVPVTVPPEMRGTPVKAITGLKTPRSIALTDDGLMVVSEDDGHCITILDKEWKKVRSFGSKGARRGQLRCPVGVAITSRGTILVVECDNNRLQEFTMEGECISCVGSKGSGPLQFTAPCGMTINKTTGQVFIADVENNRIQVLHSDLTFSHMIGSKGSGQGQLNWPVDVTTDGQGFVYVSDWGNHRIQKFTTMGQFVSSFGTKGSQPGQLKRPSGITIDNDLLYVNNAGNKYITVYSDGQQVSSIKNKEANQFIPYYCGITTNSNGGLLAYSPSENSILEL